MSTINYPHSTTIHHVLRILEGVRTILTPPSAWTRNVPARNKHNQPVLVFDTTATCYDILGAIMVVSDRANLRDYNHTTMMYLRNFTDGKGVGVWNDDRDLSHGEMLATLDNAILKLKEKYNEESVFEVHSRGTTYDGVD